MTKYFGTDGVRGRVDEKLTVEMAYRIGRFIGQYPNGKQNRIIISRDTRISGKKLLDALIEGIRLSGGHVYDEGVSTTPSISYIVETKGFDYGIMISASHNPYYDNGIKIFDAKGKKLSSDIEELIEVYMDSPTDHLPKFSGAKLGALIDGSDLREEYVNFLVSKAKFDFANLHILVDCANGSASNIAPQVFKRLGINAEFINNNPNGLNINEKCGSTHLESIIEHSKKDSYDLCFAFDGDADRLLVVKDGEVIDGDMMIYMTAISKLDREKLDNNAVVITVMSNLGLKLALERHNIQYIEVDVGDKYVQAKLEELDLSLGGEQSGHVIFFHDLNTGDGILTAIKMMTLYVGNGYSFDELKKDLAIFPQVLINVKVNDKKAVLGDEGLLALIEKEKALLGKEGRLLVRPSGTEPLVRVMTEARTLEICNGVCGRIKDHIEKLAL
ncbi:MAG TPA: phosphoglucosamine mutase [Bacilli bacterium]|nr:phosphoglucosamine mutase [Bacilli bacterium]